MVKSKSNDMTLAIELAFIARMLDDPSGEIPSALNEGVEEDWFTDDRCRAVWRAARKTWGHSDGGSTIDSMEIMEAAGNEVLADPKEFGDAQIGFEFYEEATRYAITDGDTAALVGSLRNSAMARRMRESYIASDKILSEGGSASDAIGELSRRISDIQAMTVASGEDGCYDLVLKNIESWKHARHEVVDNHNSNFVIGLPVPWTPLSKSIRGLQVGMHVIAARPSVGKTSFGMQLVLSLAKAGYHVGFNSIDMSVEQLMKRPVSSLAQIALEPLDNGFATDEDFEKVGVAAETVREWQEKGILNLTQKYNVYDFASWCSVKHAEGKLDIVFVDYIQKMNAGRKLVGEAAMKEVSSVTSSISKRLKIPVVALAQLNRSNEKDGDGGEREPRISDIRESGAIEQDAFTIMLLYNDPGVKKAWEENPPMMMDPLTDYKPGASLKPVWVHLAKNQNGRTGRFPFVVYQNTFTWYLGDMDAEKESGAGANINKFSKIVPDGRNKIMEDLLMKSGYVVGSSVASKPASEEHDTVAAASPVQPSQSSDTVDGIPYVNDFSSIEDEFTF